MFLKKKRSYQETIYGGAVDIKETFYHSSVDMKSRLVSFLKQAKNRVSDWSLWGKAIAC